jgi:hypothetical protein
MTVRIAHIRNPLAPQLEMRTIDVEPGVVLTCALADAEWKLPPSTFLLRRDVVDREIDWEHVEYPEIFVRRSDWDLATLEDGDCAVLITLPQGGGGGGGSQVLKIVATIALIIAAAVFAGPLGASLADGSLGTAIGLSAAAGSAIVASSIIVGGQLILSAILPQPKPAQQKAASPTYTFGLQSNQARIGSAVPEWFGLYNQVPDLRAQPWINYENNEEDLYELFCLGKGSYQIQQIRIGTNAIATLNDEGVLVPTGTYPEIEWQIAGPNETLSLFPDNIVTSTDVSGIELLGTNEDDYGPTDWFVVCPPGTETHAIAFDMTLPGGLYHSTDSGNINRAEVDFEAWAQPIDDYGNPTGDAIIILDTHLVLATNTPQRLTYHCVVDSARYQVRMERTNPKGTTTSISDTIEWLSLRAILPSDLNYGDCTMIAIAATATASLNGSSSDQFNTIAMRELITPVLIDGAWHWSESPQPTRSIGAAAYYLLTSSNNADIDPSMIDGDWLLAYEPVWQGRGDTFDGGFDTQGSFWDNLNQCLNVGRTQALPGPLISFVRDEPKTLYRCAFSSLQTATDSFTINYVFFDENNADAANVTYMDEVNWQSNTVFCKLPGSTLNESTAPQVNAFGMVSRDQVYRTWMYNLAASCYRRQFPQFDTELDGRVCQRGDLVKISHIMPQWGAAALVMALEEDDEDGDLITLSEPWTLDRSTPVVTLSTPDGYVAGPATVTIVDDGATTHRAQLRFTASCTSDQGNFAGMEPRDWGIWGDTVRGLQRERPKCLMGTNTTSSVDALVVSMTPQSGLNATVACVVDNPAVYTADQGTVPERAEEPPDDPAEDLQIVALNIREVPAFDGLTAMCSVTIAGAADQTGFSYRTRYLNGGTWSGITNVTGRVFSFLSGRGTIQLQVRALGTSSIGDWFETDIEAEGYIEVVNATFDFSQRANSGNLALMQAAWMN